LTVTAGGASASITVDDTSKAVFDNVKSPGQVFTWNGSTNTLITGSSALDTLTVPISRSGSVRLQMI